MKHCYALLFLFCIGAAVLPAQSSPYYEGTGGAGIRVAVLQPSGSGLSPQEQWLVRLIQSTFIADFNKYSAMTAIDRQNLDTVLGEQNRSFSGNYSEADYINIGNLANVRYILAGTLTKIGSNFMLVLSVADAQTGARTVSLAPKSCSLDELQSTTIIKQAAEELLGQMGVTLTATGRQDLRNSISAVPQAVSGAEAAASAMATVTASNGQRVFLIDYLLQTADALYAAGELQEALPHYRSLVSYFPGYYRGWLGIVRCLSGNLADFDFANSEIYMERASITTLTNAERQEVQQARTVFDAQWPRIAAARAQRAVEEARRREGNSQPGLFRVENDTLLEFRGGIAEAIVPPEVTTIGHAAFRQKDVKRVVLHNRITTIDREAFSRCGSLEEIIIPSSVTSIGRHVFYECASLAEITIPARITVIPESAFSGCTALQSVTISPGVQRIESGAFRNCENLTAIVIPRSVQSIGDGAFSNCKNLKYVTLLSSSITIGRRAFMGTSLVNREEMISRFGATLFN